MIWFMKNENFNTLGKRTMAMGLSAAVATLALSGCFDSEEMPTCKVDVVTAHGEPEFTFGLITTGMEESSNFYPDNITWSVGGASEQETDFDGRFRYNFGDFDGDDADVGASVRMAMTSLDDGYTPPWGEGDTIECTPVNVGLLITGASL